MESITVETVKPLVMEYLKRFGSKGKLPAFDGSLRDCYAPYLQQAFEWASQKVDEVRMNGDAWFDRSFRIDVVNNFVLNKRNLIYVERNIDIDFNGDLNELQYSSIGECWSWKRSNGRSYCSDLDKYKNGIYTITICGYVHPESVDWLETIYLNSYDMKNETEIRMNDNAVVEVAYIKIWGEKVPTGGSYLINASADKYRKKDW